MVCCIERDTVGRNRFVFLASGMSAVVSVARAGKQALEEGKSKRTFYGETKEGISR